LGTAKIAVIIFFEAEPKLLSVSTSFLDHIDEDQNSNMCADNMSSRVPRFLQLFLTATFTFSHLLCHFELRIDLLIPHLSTSFAYTAETYRQETMATRRSTRIRLNLATKAATKPSANAGRKSRKSPTPPPPTTHGSVLHDAQGYLQRIYTAVDQICRRGRPKPRTSGIVNDIIIQARCARILTHLPDAGRAAYLAAIATTSSSLYGRSQIIAEHMRRLGHRNATRRRFSDFVDRFGFLLLSICAHSKSFRFLLLQAHVSIRNRLLWQDLCDLIKRYAYSIGLYARTRGLDWNRPLTEGSNDWDRLICRPLYDILEHHNTFSETQVLGISDTEYCIRHELSDNIGHYHEWVVASEPRTAYNPEMTYLTGRAKSPRLVAERQVNIGCSIIRDRPVWINRKKWPIDDPRYRGPISAPCEVCPNDVNNGRLAGEYCDHTLAELCKSNHSKIAKASSRVELLQYPKKGVGVRSLKAFRENEILAEYVGEIYPEHVVRKDCREEVVLYPSDNGVSYRYQQTMEARDVDDDGKKRKSSSPGKESDSMVIDPAIRGNWTRYMNHSCREATEFQYRFVGDKKLTLIVACRDIQFGEELTVNYETDYWKEATYGCACGEDQCTLWDAEKNKAKGGNKVTWAEEKERLRTAQEEAAKEVRDQQKRGSKQSNAKDKKGQTTKTSDEKPRRGKRKHGGDDSKGLLLRKQKGQRTHSSS
jgi:SET domain